jgi:hypothetical protein
VRELPGNGCCRPSPAGREVPFRTYFRKNWRVAKTTLGDFAERKLLARR